MVRDPRRCFRDTVRGGSHKGRQRLITFTLPYLWLRDPFSSVWPWLVLGCVYEDQRKTRPNRDGVDGESGRGRKRPGRPWTRGAPTPRGSRRPRGPWRGGSAPRASVRARGGSPSTTRTPRSRARPTKPAGRLHLWHPDPRREVRTYTGDCPRNARPRAPFP